MSYWYEYSGIPVDSFDIPLPCNNAFVRWLYKSGIKRPNFKDETKIKKVHFVLPDKDFDMAKKVGENLLITAYIRINRKDSYFPTAIHRPSTRLMEELSGKKDKVFQEARPHRAVEEYRKRYKERSGCEGDPFQITKELVKVKEGDILTIARWIDTRGGSRWLPSTGAVTCVGNEAIVVRFMKGEKVFHFEELKDVIIFPYEIDNTISG